MFSALSRHSLYPLLSFASPESSSSMGFVREVTSQELEAFAQQNRELLQKKYTESMIFPMSH